ncbi:uncharacterized protein B0H64DRAFT_399507 [Chaetomium fimeti]|uniref:RNA polymerase II subunit B1 CTD phosphatase RPAP2 homolog n=1 Tax=Chaetomium fimeti TaxID=1854472 RepID=A0AAE0LQT1_9PEZI|nr:hypothetical protein B0H64DRAFT_399507 [Chaetomium fimeti]
MRDSESHVGDTKKKKLTEHHHQSITHIKMATPSAMMSQTNPPSKPKPKGILKQPTARPPQDEAATTELTRAEILARNENAARLRLLQKLRDTQLKPPVPLSTFETLCQLPHSSTHPASAPSPEDTRTFLTLLTDFQPSEYLDLIEERNCLGKCGYALCGRARRAVGGAFSIGPGGIARAGDVNKWCSDACARRALHLKVQLDNPSYVRDGRIGGGMVVKLELRDEGGQGGQGGGAGGSQGGGDAAKPPRGKEEDRNELAQVLAKLEIDRQMNGKKTDESALAGERGDATGGLLAGVTRVDVNIKEAAAVGPTKPPGPQAKGGEFTIEGYTPKIFREGKGPGTSQALAEGNGSETAKKPAEGDESGGSEDDDDDDDFFTVRF